MRKGRKPANGVSSKSRNYRLRMTSEDYDRLAEEAKAQNCKMADILNGALSDYYGRRSNGPGESDQAR